MNKEFKYGTLTAPAFSYDAVSINHYGGGKISFTASARNIEDLIIIRDGISAYLEQEAATSN